MAVGGERQVSGTREEEKEVDGPLAVESFHVEISGWKVTEEYERVVEQQLSLAVRR